MIKKTIYFAIGFLLSLYIFRIVYNPLQLKNVAYDLASRAYYLGCLEQNGSEAHCKEKAKNYTRKIAL